MTKYVPFPLALDVVNGTNTPDDTFGHGTWCVGVAAAQTNNNQGIAGVAPNCLIMPIRLYVSNDIPIQTEFNILRAINWARMHGANVISMSWNWTGLHPSADIALEDAYQANIVLVAASGNCFEDQGCTDPQGVTYPASHLRVIAVGASDENDFRQNRNNNFEPKWDSRYGPEFSVVAPGVNCPMTSLASLTTNSPLGIGYDKFYGTSAAAPHVAGLAALLLSYRPYPRGVPPILALPRHRLSNSSVRYIIEASAEKIGDYTYANDPSHPNGTWYPEVGYGRINVFLALRFAESYHIWFALVVSILFGVVQDGPGVVLPPGGPPTPVDPGGPLHLTPEQRDVLLGLAITKLAQGANDPETRRALERAGWDAIERTAQRMGQGRN